MRKIGILVSAVTAAWCVTAAACSRGSEAAPATPATNAAASNDTPHTATRTNRRHIVFMGTSLTAGLGLEPEQAYSALIQQKIDSAGLPYVVRNAGVSGETSAGALRRIGWVLRDSVDVFVLETGANDGLRGLGVDSMKANIQAIFDSVKSAKPQAKLVLVQMEAPPNLGQRYTRDFHQAFADLAKKNGATLVPFLLAGVAGDPSLNQADGIHPNVRGERIVADNVWRAIEPLLAPGTAATGAR